MNEKPTSQKHRPWLILAIALLLLAGIAAVRHYHFHPSSSPANAQTELPSKSETDSTPASPPNSGDNLQAARNLYRRLSEAQNQNQNAHSLPNRPGPLSDGIRLTPAKSQESPNDEIKALDAPQIRELAAVIVEETTKDGRMRTSQLGAVLRTWVNAQKDADTQPLQVVLDILGKYMADLSSTQRSGPLYYLVMENCSAKRAAAITDYMLLHPAFFPGDGWDEFLIVVRSHLLSSQMDQERKDRLTAMPHDFPDHW